MSKGERAAIVIGILGLVLMGVPVWDILDKRGVMVQVLGVASWCVSLLMVGYAVYRNLKDVHREKSMRAEIVKIRNDHEVQMADALRNQRTELTDESARLLLETDDRWRNDHAKQYEIQERRHLDKLNEVTRALRSRPLSTREIDELKRAGECELLAWDAAALIARLKEVVGTLELEGNKDALVKLNYPLFMGYPDESDLELWKWWHRSLIKFHDGYAKHRKQALTLPGFESVVTKYPLGSNAPDTERFKLIDGLGDHRRKLLSMAATIVSPYVDSADRPSLGASA